MQTKVIAGLIFLAGVGVGVAVGCYAVKNKYIQEEQEARQAHLDQVKEYKAKLNEVEKNYSDIFNAPEIEKAKEIMEKEGYLTLSEAKAEPDEEEELTDENAPVLTEIERRELDRPYVISPSEFGELDYEKIELTYYADGILTDDRNEIMDDPDDIIGPDALDSFGDYEDDSVYVRNDGRRCDYAILKDLRNYRDVVRRGHRA